MGLSTVSERTSWRSCLNNVIPFKCKQSQMIAIKRSARRFVVGAIGLSIGYCFGVAVAMQAVRLLGNHLILPLTTYRIVGGLVLFWIVMEVGDACERLFESAASGTTCTLTRYLAGQFWRAVAFVATVLSFVAPLSWLLLPVPQPWLRIVAYQLNTTSITFGHLAGIGFLILIFTLPKPVHFFARLLIGRVFIYLSRSARYPQDGQARSMPVAGLLEEWANPHRPCGIFLGRSLCDPSWSVGVNDDRHVLTIASGAVQSRSTVHTHLSKWPHSALIIDTKGTNSINAATTRTFSRRYIFERKHRNVYVLDPFAVSAGFDSMLPSSHFNPLSIIDLSSLTVDEDLDMLADAIVMPTSSDADFWDINAKVLIRAAIGHAVSIDPHNASLITVRQILAGMVVDYAVVLQDMMRNPLAGGVIRDSARQIAASDSHVVSKILSVALQHTDWLNDSSIQAVLSKSDFDLLDLMRRPTTIYVVLPPDRLETYSRFLRIFVNLAMATTRRKGPSRVPFLLVVDQLSVLGHMESLSAAIGSLADYGVKLWLTVESLSQLIELYAKNWTTDVANAWHLQIIDVKDRMTAAYVSQKIGRTVFFNEGSNPVCAQTTHSAGVMDLRGDDHFDPRASPRHLAQLIVREGASPFLLRR